MNDQVQVIGFFPREEQCASAISALRRSGLGWPLVYAPVPSERILQAMDRPKSPVRRWVLAGGISGVISGIALTVGLSLEWPHLTGGKPNISIPPFIIICFELMILLGALSAVAGFLIHGRFPRFDPMPGYSPRFSDDRFGVVIRCAAEEHQRAEKILNQAGAEEVKCETVQ